MAALCALFRHWGISAWRNVKGVSAQGVPDRERKERKRERDRDRDRESERERDERRD